MQLDDGEVLAFTLDGSSDDHAVLRRLFGHRTSVDAAIDPAQILELACPETPADLPRWLAENAPLLPAALVWTRPFASARNGRQVVALARKDWLIELCRRFEAASRVPVRPVHAEARVPFCHRSPLACARWLTSLAVGSLSLAIASALLAGSAMAPKREDQAPAPQSGDVARLFSGAGFARTIAAAIEDVPPQASLAAIASPANGRRQVELLTLDPDQLREQLQAAPFFRDFAEAGQVRQPDMKFRMTYSADPAAPAPALPAAKRAKPIAAASAAEAEDILRRQVEAKALAARLSLRLLPDGRQETGVLRLHITAAGPQDAVFAFAQALESSTPAARLAAWRLDADPAGLRLAADLFAPWTVRQ